MDDFPIVLLVLNGSLLGAWGMTVAWLWHDYRQRRELIGEIATLRDDLLLQIKQVALAKQSTSDEIGAIKIKLHDLVARQQVMK